MKILFKYFLIFIPIVFTTNLLAQKTIIMPPNDSNGIGDTTLVFTSVDIEASFPGGQAAWTKYITNQIMQSIDRFRKNDYGTCHIRFIVGKDGTISNAEAMDMKNSHLAKIAVEAIKNGPRWMPAQQNGRNVNAYRVQPVTVVAPEK